MLKLPENVLFVIDSLEQAGFEAYAVGGCVRDALMGFAPHDWDVTTSALPEEIYRVFSGQKLIDTGLQHGTVTVLSGGQPVEVTTFRADGAYSDNRHPDSVRFVRSLSEDLSRRDFTINAMAYSPDRGFTDLYGGRVDIDSGILRCVGDPAARFREDALRILRALRFASRLGFELEENTAAAIHECRELLKNIAAERIFSELCGILTGVGAGEVLAAYGDVVTVILPERAKDWLSACSALSAAPADLFMRLYLILEPDSASCRQALTHLRCDNITKTEVLWLCDHGGDALPESARAMRVYLAENGVERAKRLIEMKSALAASRGDEPNDENAAWELYGCVLAESPVLSIKQLAVSGGDLMAEGLPEGKLLGEILNSLFRLVVTGSLKNDRALLLARAKEMLTGKTKADEVTCEAMASQAIELSSDTEEIPEGADMWL